MNKQANNFPAKDKDEPPDYQDGYSRTLREVAWVHKHGFEPSERRLVLALMQAAKIYDTVRTGKSIAGRDPEWLRGRADALRMLLAQGVEASSTDLEQ